MVDVRNYNFNIITKKTVKPEEYFINSYVNKCLEYDSEISATCRMRRILDPKYEKAKLNKVMTKKCQHLNTKERRRLLILFRKFEDLFNGTLGTWTTTLLDLELNYDVKPVCSRPYPVPRVHELIFRKKSERLVSL